MPVSRHMSWGPPLPGDRGARNSQRTLKWAPLDVAFVVRYRPGMYLYLHLPEVARREWHPFSLAGAPNAQSLAVFVRQNGKPAGTACATQIAVLGDSTVRPM